MTRELTPCCSYSFTAGNNRGKGENGSDQRSEFLNLRPGLNLGAWRFRNYSTNKTSGDGDAESQFSSVYTYAQRDIIALGGNVTFGQSSSPSDVFDSISYTGAQIASDDDMLPDSMKGFAPVIRGTAHSNAGYRSPEWLRHLPELCRRCVRINDLPHRRKRRFERHRERDGRQRTAFCGALCVSAGVAA